jgi:type IV secretion system protein VirB7
MRLFVIGLLLACGLTSCTSKAGPFVTNISSDGRGGLVVEKCMMQLNRQITTVENSDCTHAVIYLKQ